MLFVRRFAVNIFGTQTRLVLVALGFAFASSLAYGAPLFSETLNGNGNFKQKVSRVFVAPEAGRYFLVLNNGQNRLGRSAFSEMEVVHAAVNGTILRSKKDDDTNLVLGRQKTAQIDLRLEA